MWIYYTFFCSTYLTTNATLSRRCCFIVSLEIRLHNSPNFIFLFKNCFGSYDFSVNRVFFFLIKKHNKIYPFSQFESIQFSSVKYIYAVVKQIFRTFSSCKSEILFPLNNNAPFPFPEVPGNHHSTFCFDEFNCFRCPI